MLAVAATLAAAPYEDLAHGFRLEIPGSWKRDTRGLENVLRVAAPGGFRARVQGRVRAGGVDMAAALRARDGDQARLSRKYSHVTPLGPPAINGWVGDLQAWTWSMNLRSPKGTPMVYRAWLVRGPDSLGGRDLILKAAVLARVAAWNHHRAAWEDLLAGLEWPVPMLEGPNASDLVFAELFPEGTPDWIKKSRLDASGVTAVTNSPEAHP
jgi:hypothetical protein